MFRSLSLRVLWTLGCTLGAACSLPAAEALGPSDFIAADGPWLRRESGHGEAVLLRGTNIGGWLMHESWMSPIGLSPLAREGWKIEAPGGTPESALDGDVCTTWLPPQEGAVLVLRTPGPSTFDRVRLLLSSAPAVAPTVALEYALAGGGWKPLEFATELSGSELSLRLKDGCTADALRMRVPASFPVLAEWELLQDDDHTARATLERRFGWEHTARLIRAYHRIWFNEQDLDELAAMHFNLLRVPMNWLDFTDERGVWRKDAFATLDWLVAECGRRGIYVLLDMHAVPGGADPWDSSGHAGNDGTGYNPNGFWSDPAKQALLAKIWEGIARHYRANPAVAGYDLVNEPLLSYDENLPDKREEASVRKGLMYDRLYRAVRTADPEHLVVIEAFSVPPPANSATLGSVSGFLAITPPTVHGWTNVLYQTHHYDMAHPEDEAAQQRLVDEALADIRAHREAWGVPVYAGEYCLYQFPAVWRRWMLGLSELGVAWSNWTYKVRGSKPSEGGGNWGFFNNNAAPVPDLARDSEEEILRKWEAFGSAHFHRNQPFIELVGEASREGARRLKEARP